MHLKIGGLVHERRNSIANALELHLSCTNPLKCCHSQQNVCLVHSFLILLFDLFLGKICREDGQVDPLCFARCQEYVVNIMDNV